MIETAATVVGWALLGAGAAFYLIGAIGLVRMPDLFTRMHAGGISDTAGAGLLIAGMMATAGLSLVTAKLAIILAIILFTSPIATHALAQAALHAGLKPALKSRRVLGPATGPHPFEEKAAKAAAPMGGRGAATRRRLKGAGR